MRGNAGAVGKDRIAQDPDDNGESLKDVKLESDVIYTHYGYRTDNELEETKPEMGVGLEVIQGRNIGSLNKGSGYGKRERERSKWN